MLFYCVLYELCVYSAKSVYEACFSIPGRQCVIYALKVCLCHLEAAVFSMMHYGVSLIFLCGCFQFVCVV